MLIVGLNFAHDAGVCIVADGHVLGMFQRERFTRVKRQGFMRADFLRFCLDRAGVDWADVDSVAVTSAQAWPFILLERERLRIDHDVSAFDDLRFNDLPPEILAKSADRIRARTPHAIKRYGEFAKTDARYREYFGADRVDGDPETGCEVSFDWPIMPAWWQQPLTAKQVMASWRGLDGSLPPRFAYSPIRVTLDGVAKPGAMVPHHMSHAAASYYPSDRERCAVQTLDNGDGLHVVNGYKGGIYAYGIGNRLIPVAPTYDIHGHFYQRVAEGIRLGHGAGAGKLMGLAPYGEPVFFQDSMVGNAFDLFGTAYAFGDKENNSHVIKHLIAAAEQQRRSGYNSPPKLSPHYDPDAFGAENVVRPGIDMAMSAQKVFEENALRSIRLLHAGLTAAGLTAPTLALSGGGALNCPANSRIWGEGLFEDMFVPPYCDDSGLALGAALALAHDVLDEPRQTMSADVGAGAYLGLAYDRAAVDAALEPRHDAVEEVAVGDAGRAAAADVAAGRIVAWFEGRSEVGPRALGHRSILADPRDATKWREVNRVKKREYWRPFAPAVLAEKAGDWFSGAPTPSPFMLFNAQVRSKDLPAITHVDGSARIQTVDASCGGFRGVLEAFEAETGVPVVMNTSFNGPGEPIVETPDQALAFLETSEIDAVYVNGRKFQRRG